MEDVGIFYGHLVYFTAIWYILRIFWYILWLFGIFLANLVCLPKKNLATLQRTQLQSPKTLFSGSIF
jgi:hypothetical protein